ncbi:MAG: sugar phosphate isomerase/epimerase family protein [Saccharofermentanales bacterium]
MIDFSVGLQLFSIRDELKKDYYASLEKVRKIGYENIEMGGFGPFNTKEWNEVQKNLGLKVISNHVQIDMLEDSFNHIAEFNQAIGCRNIVIPYLGDDRRVNADSYKKLAETLNIIGRKCEVNGLRLSYHNHNFEFTKFDGVYGMDILIDNTDSKLVFFELDVFWVKFGGENPIDYIRKVNQRCDLIHLKDMITADEPIFAEVGEGVIDFKPIINEALKTGVKYFIVEQDVCRRPSFDCVETSFENIKKIKKSI